MYRRAELSRTATFVVALQLAAFSTYALARVADTRNNYPAVQALRFMGGLIAERSSGNHIRVFHSSQLGEERQALQQTRTGVMDINRTNAPLIGTMVTAANVLAIPFLFRSIEHLQEVLHGPIGTEFLGSLNACCFVIEAGRHPMIAQPIEQIRKVD